MSDVIKLNVADAQALLIKKGAALGISAADVVTLLSNLGPLVVDLIMKLLEWKRSQGLVPKAPQPGAINLSILEQLLATLLTQYKPQVEQWIENGEGVVFDALIKALGNSRPLIAKLLAAYKTTIIDAINPEINSAIDAVIAYLEGQTPQPAPEPTPPPTPAPAPTPVPLPPVVLPTE